jgi:hypothetical protein
MIFNAYTTPVSFFLALTTFRHIFRILGDKTIFIQENEVSQRVERIRQFLFKQKEPSMNFKTSIASQRSQ